jgi:protein TonB
MNATREIFAVRRWPAALRWGACFALALGIHAAGAVALLARWNEDADSVANAPVIMIELAALPVAPDIKPTELLPGPQQTETQPQPAPIKPVEKPIEKTIELPPAPRAEPQLAVLPPPKPVEKSAETKPRQKHASLTSAPSTAEHRAERAAAPAPGTASRNPDAVPNWKSRLVARLERYKRYPSQAQSRGEQGVAQLAFSIDRSGGVHHARILRSSGSSLLDAATLDLVERAAPLPPPPPEIHGSQIAIVVPIRYNIR